MKKTMTKRAGSAVSFVISCFAAVFVFSLVLLAARNIDGMVGGSALLGYNAESGIFNFFGEALELPKNIVNAVIGAPSASANFILGLLPSSAALVIKSLFGALWESFCELGGAALQAVVDFLRLGD